MGSEKLFKCDKYSERENLVLSVSFSWADIHVKMDYISNNLKHVNASIIKDIHQSLMMETATALLLLLALRAPNLLLIQSPKCSQEPFRC
jgi:hypothetical protein